MVSGTQLVRDRVMLLALPPGDARGSHQCARRGSHAAVTHVPQGTDQGPLNSILWGESWPIPYIPGFVLNATGKRVYKALSPAYEKAVV